MNGSRMKFVLVGATCVCALLLATSAQASLVGVLEQLSPTPTVYIQGTTGDDPAPPGIDFTTFAEVPEYARGDVTGILQYVPGLADDPQDFIDAGFVAGNIALIERGAVSFTSKIVLADAAGAIGVLIANTTPSGAGGLFEGGASGASNIPALMIRHGLGQEFMVDLLLGATIEMHLSVTDPPPPPEPPHGIWNTRIISIDGENGATDVEVNDTAEALAIVDFADGGANVNGWNIRYDDGDNRNLIDMAGGGGTFPVNHPYPRVGGAIPGGGDDFLVTAQTAAPMMIPEGDWTIAFGSDDGGALRIPGVVFANEINTNGDPGLDDSILFNDVRGHGWTAGEFTVGPGGLEATIEAIMFERGGGDSFEIAISPGHNGNGVADDGTWVLLGDGAHGWTMVPEPSSLVLAGLGLIGLLAAGLRRRKTA